MQQPSRAWAEAPAGAFAPLPAFTDQELDSALAEANLPILLGSLALMTGDDRWIEEPFLPTPPKDLGDHDGGGFSDEVAALIRASASAEIKAWRDGQRQLPVEPPTEERVARILGVMLAESVPADYGRLLGEEMGLFPRHSEPAGPVDPDFKVAIIGAGISGLAMAIRLEQAGIDYVVLEKNHDVGGSWHENVYPGCGVDTPSYLYALSFDPNPDWTRYFAPQPELATYWHSLADKHGVLPRVRFGTRVGAVDFDEASTTWELSLSDADTGERTGSVVADVVVSAVGLLNTPSVPPIPGLDDFEGPVHHTARWDAGLDLSGKRLAVIGTGASSMQLVPASARVADRVSVFQRVPEWAMPHPLQRATVGDSMHFLNRHVPFYMAWYRARLFWRMGDKVWGLLQVDNDYEHLGRAINKGNDRLRAFLTAYIENELKDHPELLEKCIPDYPPYGRRLLIDNGWFRTLTRDNVDLVTEAIDRITARGIRTVDGVEHEVDVLALATGFRAVDVLSSIQVRGRDGRTLKDVWGEGDGRAHLGISIPGFPNFFCLYGPNTNTGHGGTVIAGTEMQVQHVSALIAAMVDRNLASIEVRSDVHDGYNVELDEALDRTVWGFKAVATYYRNAAGRIVTNSPWKYVDYWKRVHEPVWSDYVLTERTQSTPQMTSAGDAR